MKIRVLARLSSGVTVLAGLLFAGGMWWKY